MNSAYRLLAACTCMEKSPDTRARIAQAATDIEDWRAVLSEAENQRMSPLLYQGLKIAGVALQPEITLHLKALYLRHRLINRVRSAVLAEILAAAQAVGIFPLVVKGAALSQFIYEDPALRPMVDIDLLVNDEQLLPLQKIMLEMGFTEPLSVEEFREHRHLPPLSKEVEGFNISIEIHHSLFSFGPGRFWGKPSDFISAPAVITIGPDGRQAHTLGNEDMIMHLCTRMTLGGGELEPFRLQWIADIHAFLIKFGAQTDWERVRQKYPAVLNTLAQVNFLTPLPSSLIAQAILPPGQPPRGVGEAYHGWPTIPFYNIPKIGYWALLRQTLSPSPWWLGLYYGRKGPGHERRYWLRHITHILALAIQRFPGFQSSTS